MKNAFYDFTAYNIPNSENLSAVLSGENQRHILIGFLDEQRDELKGFLTKIITAAKVDIEKDCLILRGDAANVALPSFSNIKSTNTIKKAVLFGIKGKDLGFNIETPLYIPFAFHNCQFLFADNLSAIENSVERKKALWLGLQTLFL